MINAILRLSVERRFLMLSLILVLVGVGVWSFQRLPIDAVPDITNEDRLGRPYKAVSTGKVMRCSASRGE